MRSIPLDEITGTFEELTFMHTVTHVIKGDSTKALISLRIENGLPPENSVVSVGYRPRIASQSSPDFPTRKAEALLQPGEGLLYQAEIPNIGRGQEISYWFQLENEEGETMTVFPARNDSQNEKLWIRFEGSRSTPLLIVHIGFMFGSFLLMVLAFMTAWEHVKESAVLHRLSKLVLWATVCLFIGVIPVGFWINYQVYAAYWTGFPLGRDITDSKSLLILLYWILLLFYFKGSVFSQNPARNLAGAAGLKWMTIFGVLLSLAAFLIPHSSGNF